MATSSARELRRLKVMVTRGAVVDWAGVTDSCVHVIPRKVLTVGAVHCAHQAGVRVCPFPRE